MTTPRTTKKVGRGGKRRLTGWTLIALGLLVAGVWGASGWWQSEFHSGRGSYFITGGEFGIEISEHEFGYTESLRTDRHDESLQWWHGWSEGGGYESSFQKRGLVYMDSYKFNQSRIARTFIVFWPIPLLLWAAGVPVLRSGILARRRAMTGQCGKCGYSLAGLGARAACPECGRR